MTKRYPFKFLDAYNKTDTDIFFGRDEEIEALYKMTFQSDILLVYGASGTGKTSLINCGLASRFKAHDWLALNIRRGNDLNAALQQRLDQATAGRVTATPDLDLSWLDEEEEEEAAGSGSPLSRQLQEIYRQYFRPVYLIFDQFEELYILGNKTEQAQFIKNVKEIQSVEHPVKMIFVIREEYLGHLFEFERAVPQLLSKKLRVEPMNLGKVGEVVRGAASLEGSNIQIQDGQEDVIVEGIFQKIKGDEQTLAIQLPYLQVFLDKLYVHVTGDENRQADAMITTQALSEIGDIGDVLRDFLEEQAIRIQKTLTAQYSNLPEDTVWQILSPLATLEGTKEPMLEETLLQRLAHLPPKAVSSGLKALDKSRILRFDENEGRYEVAHDSLAARIAEHRNDDEIAILEIRRLISNQMALKAGAREYFTEKQLNIIDPYLDKLGLESGALDFIEKSRTAAAEKKAEAERHAQAGARRRRLQKFIAVMALVSVAMIALAISAMRAQRVANAALIQAEKALADLKASQEEARILGQEVEVTAALTAIAVDLEKKKLEYKSELLQDNSGIVHRILGMLADSLPAMDILRPDLNEARSSRQIAGWYYENGKLSIIEDAIASRNSIRPGSVMFFGKAGQPFSDLNIDMLTDRQAGYTPRGAIQHIAVVTSVKTDENGDLTEYTMMHARNPRSFASRTASKEVQSQRIELPPFGNWSQQWVAIAHPVQNPSGN